MSAGSAGHAAHACGRQSWKQFTSGGSSTPAHCQEGLRSLGREAIYAANPPASRSRWRFRRRMAWRRCGPIIRDLGVALAMRRTGDRAHGPQRTDGQDGPPMNGGPAHQRYQLGICPRLPLAISTLSIAGWRWRLPARAAAASRLVHRRGGSSLGEWHEAINLCAAAAFRHFCVESNQAALRLSRISPPCSVRGPGSKMACPASPSTARTPRRSPRRSRGPPIALEQVTAAVIARDPPRVRPCAPTTCCTREGFVARLERYPPLAGEGAYANRALYQRGRPGISRHLRGRARGRPVIAAGTSRITSARSKRSSKASTPSSMPLARRRTAGTSLPTLNTNCRCGKCLSYRHP